MILSGITPDMLLANLLVIFFSIPIHEWAHCFAAHLLGDTTPESEGRLTLNPLVHLDPIGTLMILVSGWGWGRAARVNPYRMWRVQNPRVGMALTALAGPVSNIIQALILAIPVRLGILAFLSPGPASRLWNILGTMIWVNISLALFNLIPIPPLDGSRILVGVAPPKIAAFIEDLEPVAPYILLAVLFLIPQVIGINLISALMSPVQSWLFNMMLWS